MCTQGVYITAEPLLEPPFPSQASQMPTIKFIGPRGEDTALDAPTPTPAELISPDETLIESSRDKWKRLQRADSILKEIIDFVSKRTIPPSSTLEIMQKRCVNFAMFDGLLHYLVKVKEEPCWPLVVPESLQEYILFLFHNHAASAHFSEGKMMQRLLRRFTWKFMSTDVHNYAKGCLFCKQRKTAQDIRAGTPGVMPMPTGPRIIVTLDFVGPIVPSVPHGFAYILSMHCYFSRYGVAVAAHSTSAKETAALFFKHWISPFGIPEIVLHDRGSSFTAIFFQALCGIFGIDTMRTAAYHPQTDGLEESSHRSLNVALSAMVNSAHTNWPDHLPMVMYATRNQYHDAIQMTPHEAFFGMKPKLPTDILLGPVRTLQTLVRTQMLDLPLLVRATWERTLNAAIAERKETFSARFRQQHPVRFEENSLVMVHVPPFTIADDSGDTGSSNRFKLRWEGPFICVKQLSPTNCLILNPRTGSKDSINVARLTKFEPFVPLKAKREKNIAAHHEQRIREAASRPNAVPIASVSSSSSSRPISTSSPDSTQPQQQLSLLFHNLSPSEIAVVTRKSLVLGTTPAEDAWKQKEENRRMSQLLQHLNKIRTRFALGAAQAEPLYTDCTQVLARIKDLTELYDRVELWNFFYSERLRLRDFPDQAVFPNLRTAVVILGPVSNTNIPQPDLVERAEYHSFEEFNATGTYRVANAPAPQVSSMKSAFDKRYEIFEEAFVSTETTVTAVTPKIRITQSTQEQLLALNTTPAVAQPFIHPQRRNMISLKTTRTRQ